MTNLSELCQTAAQLKPLIAEDPYAWEGRMVFGLAGGYQLGVIRKEQGKITVAWSACLASARTPCKPRLFQTIDAALSAASDLGLTEVGISLHRG